MIHFQCMVFTRNSFDNTKVSYIHPLNATEYRLQNTYLYFVQVRSRENRNFKNKLINFISHCSLKTPRLPAPKLEYRVLRHCRCFLPGNWTRDQNVSTEIPSNNSRKGWLPVSPAKSNRVVWSFFALIGDWTETHVPHTQPIRYGKSRFLHAHRLPLPAPSASHFIAYRGLRVHH